MNHVRTAGNIAMGKRRCRHSWIPYHLQKRKCCSIVATFQTKRKYDGSSDDVVTSTSNDISYALEKIGIPVIVKFYIGISDIQNGSPIDTMISVYAKNFNKNFRIVHRQGFITQQQILPEQILNVIEKKID